MRKPSSSSPRRTMAERADRHVLYEASVQDVGQEVRFIRDTFENLRGTTPRLLREDFCGLGSLACRWARQGPGFRAVGVDIDPEVLRHGRRLRWGRLPAATRRRVRLVRGDVRAVGAAPVDVTTALNFSYWVFMTRHEMREYFRHARAGLRDGGLLILDAFGGYDAVKTMRERRRVRNFTYVWDQAEYYPVTGEIRCHIHFRFPDRSRIDRAFSYHWRLWSLPELRELLAEAGFSRSTVYWEGTDRRGEGNGEFRPEERGEPDAGWIAYLIAER